MAGKGTGGQSKVSWRPWHANWGSYGGKGGGPIPPWREAEEWPVLRPGPQAPRGDGSGPLPGGKWSCGSCGCRKNKPSYLFCKHCGALRNAPTGSAWNGGSTALFKGGAKPPGLQGGAAQQDPRHAELS
eukprot:9475592-Pyramimonas_sp.AAC.1